MGVAIEKIIEQAENDPDLRLTKLGKAGSDWDFLSYVPTYTDTDGNNYSVEKYEAYVLKEGSHSKLILDGNLGDMVLVDVSNISTALHIARGYLAERSYKNIGSGKIILPGQKEPSVYGISYDVRIDAIAKYSIVGTIAGFGLASFISMMIDNNPNMAFFSGLVGAVAGAATLNLLRVNSMIHNYRISKIHFDHMLGENRRCMNLYDAVVDADGPLIVYHGRDQVMGQLGMDRI